MAKKSKENKSVSDTNFAVIETGGKQYLVKPGQKIRIEKLQKQEVGSALSFDKVLLLSKTGDVKIGNPYLSGIKILAQSLGEKRGDKITNVRYKSKTRHSRKQGHRQTYTEAIISDF